MTGRKFFPLLVLAGVACDSPTEVIPPEPEDVTATFIMPYPRDAGPGVEGARITCLEGCPGEPTLTTDSLGNVTFLSVFPTLKVEAQKEGYITKQAYILADKDSVVISHVWPEESRATFRRLQIPKETLLQWGRNSLGEFGRRGVYRCPVVAVKEMERPAMLHAVEHELFHANQTGVVGHCAASFWLDHEEGKAYDEAWRKDRGKGGLFPPIDSAEYFQDPLENPAEFYAWWIRVLPIGPPTQEDICTIAIARCQFMEDYFGPRPSTYP